MSSRIKKKCDIKIKNVISCFLCGSSSSSKNNNENLEKIILDKQFKTIFQLWELQNKFSINENEVIRVCKICEKTFSKVKKIHKSLTQIQNEFEQVKSEFLSILAKNKDQKLYNNNPSHFKDKKEAETEFEVEEIVIKKEKADNPPENEDVDMLSMSPSEPFVPEIELNKVEESVDIHDKDWSFDDDDDNFENSDCQDQDSDATDFEKEVDDKKEKKVKEVKEKTVKEVKDKKEEVNKVKVLIKKTPKSPNFIFKCTYCPLQLVKQKNYDKHIESHQKLESGEEIKFYKCKKCKAITFSKTHYFDHRRIVHGPRYRKEYLKCPAENCKNLYLNEAMLLKHIKANHEKEEKKLVKGLNLHYDITPEGRFKCRICQRTFSGLWILKPHMKIHTEAKLKKKIEKSLQNKSAESSSGSGKEKKIKYPKDVECKICKKFYTRKTIDRHRMDHIRPKSEKSKPESKQRSYLCNICGKNFNFESSLVRHIPTHDENNRVLCPICTKIIPSSKILQEHLKIHEPADTPCSVCGQLFNKHYLARHMQRVHCEPKYCCNICEYKTKTKYNLQNHINKSHNNNRNSQRERGNVYI